MDKYSELLHVLVSVAGAPPALAAEAVTAIQERGSFVEYERYQMYRWLAYCCTRYGRGVNNPGAFIARKLQYNQPCPDWFDPNTERREDHNVKLWDYYHAYQYWAREWYKAADAQAEDQQDFPVDKVHSSVV